MRASIALTAAFAAFALSACSDRKEPAPPVIEAKEEPPPAPEPSYTGPMGLTVSSNNHLYDKPANPANSLGLVLKGECVLVRGFEHATGFTEIDMRDPRDPQKTLTGWAFDLQLDHYGPCRF